MASGNTLFTLMPTDNEPPATVYATLDSRNGHPVLDFDPALNEAGIFTCVLPSNYGGGGLTADILWLESTATSGDVVLGVAVEKDAAGGQNFDSDNFGTESTTTGTTNGTSGIPTKTTVTVTHANMGSPSAGDQVRVRVRRVGSNGSDTMTGDLELSSVHGKET
jgi:hypothetical protein